MLVICRRRNEPLVIRGDAEAVTVTVLEFRGDLVWVEVGAPSGVRLDRGQVRVAGGNEAAAGGGGA
jgi:sRNA-binding carbon storage regulator CsrA